ncbi:hypothetical protein ASD83_19270 [Devosia sp. Root685]|nr:hypothetical protein ASD83_19270 [Devosia sp. Root685]
MIFSIFKKPSSGPSGQLPPKREKNGSAFASIPLPLGERVDRAKRETGEGAFQAGTCAIWNDIQRALESK